ncbi:MAG: 4-hydroxyphenylpyruvate dioxygenase [Rubrivivax sp.]
MNLTLDREAVIAAPNPLGLAGIEFVEYTTPRPQALGQVLEQMGFRPVARHRSREVTRYRQGGMNVVVNAHGLPPGTDESPQIAAFCLRVRDAAAAAARVVELGAWPLAVKVQPMELHIPGIHGVGASRIFFVDRWTDFSIYDVDFVTIPTVDPEVPATEGLHWFGIVQYVGEGRIADWCAFYGALFGFTALPDAQRFGILPAGRVLRSPCGSFYLQLIEPPPDAEDEAADEQLQRLAFGAPDVPAAVRALRARGVEFVDAGALHPDARGALTQSMFGGVMFELVHHVQG